MTERIVVGITGASGVIYGIRTLLHLKNAGVQTHLILSETGKKNIEIETDYTVSRVTALADHVYDENDLCAPVASGSFLSAGMAVVPCTIKTLSGIANCYAENLLQRAADVCLKEGRPLLLAVREAPLHAGHLHLMTLAAQSGAIIFPPVSSFFSRPATLEEVIDDSIGRMLMRMGIENPYYKKWGGNE
jgi:4-hydroxy-3-polyprenylbenzoate decarboxylase